MTRSRLSMMILLVLTLVLSACASSGGDEDNGGQEPDSETTVASDDDSPNPTEPSSDTEAPANGADGSVEYAFGGNWEGSGELVFFPQASVFQDDVWTLTFVEDVNQTTGALLTIRASTVDGYISYADEEVGTTGTPDLCTINVDKSDVDGSSGSFDCNDLNMIVINGSGRDGVTLTGSWDASG